MAVAGHSSPQQFRVAGVAIHAVDEEQEFAGAVVFRHGIRAAPIDATRHLAVGELIARVPLQEFLCILLVAETQQHLRGHGAVTDPRALVRPRTRLNRRTVAVDQHVRERGAQRVGERFVLRRYCQLDAIQLFAPRRRDGFKRGGGRRLRRMLRQVEHDLLTLPRLQIDVVHQCTRREPTVVVNARASYVRWQPIARRIRGERDCAERAGLSARKHCRPTVDGDAILLERQIVDPAHATLGVEKLRRRVDLERPHRERQRDLLPRLSRVAQAIDRVKRGAADLPARIRSGRQLDRAMLPLDARDRQIAVGERMTDGDVGPRQPARARPDERLDRIAAFADFERTVLGQHALLRVAVDADDRPVDLLVEVRARITAAAALLGERTDERVR